MSAPELERSVRAYARRNGLSFAVRTNPGGTSHRMFYLEGRKAAVAYHGGRDMPPGTLRAILRGLGIEAGDL